jgi:hypothetical protein
MKQAFIFALVISQSIYAQQGDYSMGAKSTGMGGTSSALVDAFCAFNNQAGVARQERSSILFSIRNLYSLEGLLAVGAAYNQKFRQGAFLFNLYRFGDRFYSEHKLGLGYSHRIRFVSLGVQVNFIQQRVVSIGSAGSFVIELGGMAEIFPGLILGACLFNPNRATIGHNVPESLPVMMKTGMAYQPDEKITLCIEVQQGPGVYTRTKIGMEYILKNLIPLRAGAVFNPAKISFGFGIYLKKINLDYGAVLDPMLGMTHELSILYQLSKK